MIRSFQYNPPAGDIPVLYRDDDLLIVSKPAGLLSVPGRAADHKDCLISRLHMRFPAALIVHRLDMATSGIMVLALNPEMHKQMSKLFENRKVTKTYIADVWGVPEQDSGMINAPLLADWPNRPRQKVDFENGKPSHTDWVVISAQPYGARLRLTPKTGRSHQLRVHMQYAGHAILGDEFYAPDDAFHCTARLHLHAESLAFAHPKTGQDLQFQDTLLSF